MCSFLNFKGDEKSYYYPSRHGSRYVDFGSMNELDEGKWSDTKLKAVWK
jgi:hypothetical protein